VDDYKDYFQGFYDDLPEQFKGKHNITVLLKAVARQLEDLYAFYYQLQTMRSLQAAEGAQLDGIGDIVALSRAQALAISKLADVDVPMDDDTYRLYLTWKIALNTSDCTHADRHRALRLFWDRTPIYYSENPAYPATMFLTVPEVIKEPEAAVFNVASMIKAAGVALHFMFPDDEYTAFDVSGGAEAHFIREFYMAEPEIVTDSNDFNAGAVFDYIREVYIQDE